MTAPTPERRVGEARVAELAKEHPGHIGLATIRDLALDLLDERAANARLTAEVERQKQLTEFMRKAGEMFLYAVEGEGICEVPSTETRDLFRWALAALSLPTPAPEATNA